MIDLINIHKQFGEKKILSELSLNIERGEKIAIIGPSGTGKSTLLRLILGLHKPNKGHVMVDGVDIHALDSKELKLLRMKFGMLFQSAALFDSMTVFENVAFPLNENFNYSKEIIKEKVENTLELVEMSGFESHMPSDLSGGQKKRIGLARAIVGEPEIILYDEPTTGLDPILSTNIEDLISKLSIKLKVTSIVITHQISTILRTADKIFMLSNGRLLDPVTPDTIYSAGNEYERFIKGGQLI